jgi:hypothetical protein
MAPEVFIARADGALWRRTVDRVLVLPDRLAAPVVLSGTAVTLWDLLESATPVQRIPHELATRFEVSVDRIEADLQTALDQMRKLSVIDIDDTG